MPPPPQPATRPPPRDAGGKAPSLWASPDALGLPQLILYVDTFGMGEALSWSPITMVMEVEQECSTRLHPRAFERLMAAVTVLTTNVFYRSLPDFIRLCLAFQGESEQAFLADSADCAWGITEALLISPPDEEEPFTDEIRAYLGHTLDSEGIVRAPDVLRIALRENGSSDLMSQVSRDYADDPEMFQMIAGVQEDRASDIDRHVRDRMRLMLSQMQTLRLRHGDAERVANHLLGNLEHMARRSTPLG